MTLELTVDEILALPVDELGLAALRRLLESEPSHPNIRNEVLSFATSEIGREESSSQEPGARLRPRVSGPSARRSD
jgi:hypothetical protein